MEDPFIHPIVFQNHHDDQQKRDNFNEISMRPHGLFQRQNPTVAKPDFMTEAEKLDPHHQANQEDCQNGSV